MTGDLPRLSTVRLVAGCVLITGLAFIQIPGFVVPDTKLDLVYAPVDFLARATHLWDGRAALGQLQNQAYGYLWPMGPFFAVGSLLAVPAWVVQRLWWGMLLSVAFVGAARLARALGVRNALACLVAGVAFALSPRMVTVVGPISIEAWPSALAPWVLLPLVDGASRGSPRRAAGRSALAVGMVGGVNAAATFAVLPLGALWLLTRSPGPRRRSMMLWWPVLVLAATSWWLVPLFTLGAYSPPFLDFIETTAVTTFPTTVFDTLRGTSDWVPYVDPRSVAGNELITTGYLALNSGVLVLVGLVGLMLPSQRHRGFLGLGVLLGVVMVTAGHSGPVEGFLASDVRGLLDGVLAPLRNVHKFDVVVRLPLVLGLAHVVDRMLEERRSTAATALEGDRDWDRRLRHTNASVVLGSVALALVATTMPVLGGRLAPGGAFLDMPDYWRQAATWLSQESGPSSGPADGPDASAPMGGATALLVPGSAFGDYVWGLPRDEPMQWLASSRWAVRNVVPLTPPGQVRFLDGIEQRLARGEGSWALTADLRRGGIRHLVVRNDLRLTGDVPDPVLVHQAIASSPGLRLATAFGPVVGGGADLRGDARGRVVVNGGWQARYRAVEIYEVPDAVPAVTARVAPVVAAGPEDLPDLVTLGVLGSAPSVLAADVPARRPKALVDAPLVLTDGLQAREHSFPRLHDGVSQVLSPDDPRRTSNRARDYALDTADRWSTTAKFVGVRLARASSSASDADNAGGATPGWAPGAAVDGDEDSQWRSGTGRAQAAWLEIRLDHPREVSAVRLVGGSQAADNQVVRVRTRAGVSRTVALGPGEVATVPTPGDDVSRVRVEQPEATGVAMALAEVRVPHLVVRRRLVLPELPAAWGPPDAIVMRRLRDGRTGCAVVDLDVRCVAGRDRPDEEPAGFEREVTLTAARDYPMSVRARPRPGPALDRLIQRGLAISIDASSAAVPDVRARALSAIDGDAGTTWLASLEDLRPSLDLAWLGTRSVTGLRLSTDRRTAGRAPTRVQLVWPQGRRTVDLRNGRVGFPPIRTERLRLRVLEAEPAIGLGFDASLSQLPVGITQLDVVGVPFDPVRLSRDTVPLPCGSGPTVTVGSTTTTTAVTASPADLAAGRVVDASPCGAGLASLVRGRNLVTASSKEAFSPDSLVLDAGVSLAPASTAPLRSSASARVVEPAAGHPVLDLRENTNPGWMARQGERPVAGVVLDGWQLGWWPHEGAGPVRARFTPDGVYRLGLGLGLALFAALAITLLPVRLRRPRSRPDGGGAEPARGAAGRASAPLEGRGLPLPVRLITTGLTAGWVAGWSGLVLAGVVFSVMTLLRRRAPEVAAWVIASTVLLAASAYAVVPWGSGSGWAGTYAWVQLAGLVPLAALLAGPSSGPAAPTSVVGGPGEETRPPRGRPQSRRRIAGRSTTR